MPIPFPSIKPSARSFTAPDYPVTSPEYVRGVTYPRLRSNRAVNAQLELTFTNITDAQASDILAAYVASRSGFHPLTMPVELVAGIDLQALRDRINPTSFLRWHFNGPPKVDAGIPGISTVNVTLVATPSTVTIGA